MAFVIVFLIIVLSVVGYVFSAKLRLRDIPVLFFLSSFVFFLSRFNQLMSFTLGDRPYVGVTIYSLLALVALLVFRSVAQRPISRMVFLPIPFLLGFGILSIMSGLQNGGVAGFFSALQVLVISLTPPLLAWVLVELYPRRLVDNLAMRKIFVVTLGLITPVILIVSALLPGVFGSLLGWDEISSGSAIGFVRGWSPLGSTIATGCLIIVAYGFALNEAVTNRSRTHTIIAALAAVSLLFTASRSVLVSFFVFNLVYALLLGNRAKIFKVAFVPFSGLAAVVGYSVINGSISFGRFLETNDFSLYIRLLSMRGAWYQFVNSFAWGRGPGLLYSHIRTDWLEGDRSDGVLRFMIVGENWSVMEPHNLYLLLLAEHGILSTIFFLLALIAVLVVVARAPVQGSLAASSEKAVYVGIWVAVMVMFFTASWPLLNQKFSIFFWLYIFSSLHWAHGRRLATVRSSEWTTLNSEIP